MFDNLEACNLQGMFEEEEMSLQLDRNRIFELIGRQDYQLAGFILKRLVKCEKMNGPEFLDMLVSEIGQPYQVGYHKGRNGWQIFSRMADTPKEYEKMKFIMWNKVYSDASASVCDRMETIGHLSRKTTADILEKVTKEAGV